MNEPQTVEQGGLILATGGLLKARDDKENPYLFAAHAPPPQVANLNEPIILPDHSHDPRASIQYQQSIGSCAAWSAGVGGAACYNEARHRMRLPMNAEMPHAGYIYEYARRKRGFFPHDTGSYLGDCADLLLEDSPRLSQHPYVSRADYAYPATLPTDDNVKTDYVGSHQAFYPRQGNVLENIWNALKAGYPIMIGMSWPNAFFNPIKGRLPENINILPSDAGHAVLCWGYLPGGDLLCQNSWSSEWAADIPRDNFCRPGDFIIPASYVINITTGPIWEYRAISPEPVIVPDPDVTPDPTSGITKAQVLSLVDPVVSTYRREVSTATTKHFKTKAKARLEGATAVRGELDSSL
jgi:hypothetical protein